MDYSINENKINQWLEEINNDRNKLFNEVKNSATIDDRVKEDKIKVLDRISMALYAYRKIFIKQKKNEIA